MHGITDHILRLLSQHWLLVSGTALLLWLVKNRYQNGLNKYPGPFLASITDWWRFLDVYGRRPELTHRALHRKYGDVVRLGPNTLSFSDPSALKSIYGLNKGFIKVKKNTHSKEVWTEVNTDSCIVRLLHRSTIRRKGPPSPISV